MPSVGFLPRSLWGSGDFVALIACTRSASRSFGYGILVFAGYVDAGRVDMIVLGSCMGITLIDAGAKSEEILDAVHRAIRQGWEIRCWADLMHRKPQRRRPLTFFAIPLSLPRYIVS